jgi:uncharacterized protein
LWVQRQNERYGGAAQTGWRIGFGIWRIVRAALNPLQAVGQATSGMFMEKTARVLSYRLRAYATRLLDCAPQHLRQFGFGRRNPGPSTRPVI